MQRTDTIVFVGSGVSAWSGMPTWRSLLLMLADHLDELGESSQLVRREVASGDYLMAASYGFHRLTVEARCDFLRSHLRSRPADISPLHRAIARLGANCFATTNYDGLLEDVLKEQRPEKSFSVVGHAQQLELAAVLRARSENFLFKAHGDINDCRSIILTREDYQQLHGERRNVLEAMRTLLVSRPVVFVGFGLRDPHFLLVEDMLRSGFHTSPRDHYAFMPDVVAEEAEYWEMNYGIKLISYATRPSEEGWKRHGALLEAIEELHSIPSVRLSGEKTDADWILALARHARRIRSSTPVVRDAIPLSFQNSDIRALPAALERQVYSHSAIGLLAEIDRSVVVSGPPGAGKTFTIQQAASWLGRQLEEIALTEDLTSGQSKLRVPIVVEMRDYRSSLEGTVAAALPASIDLEELAGKCIAVIFLDGLNEVPASVVLPDDLTQQLSSFLSAHPSCIVVLTTRFAASLAAIDLPVLTLDSIPRGHVLKAVESSAEGARPISAALLSILQRPLYFRAWQSGVISIENTQSVHDVYRQLLRSIERDVAKEIGLSVGLSSLLGRAAYEMIDSGELSIGLAKLYALLREALPEDWSDTARIQRLVNYLIGDGVVAPTPNRRLAFGHHSIAEYLAASYLADLWNAGAFSLNHYLSRRFWDHTVLLMLGFLSRAAADIAFELIVRTDAVLAIRALEFIDENRDYWTSAALELIAADVELGEELVSPHLLVDITVTAANIPQIRRLIEFGDELGGYAAALLWRISNRADRSELLRSVLDDKRGFNFIARFGEQIAGQVDRTEVSLLLDILADFPENHALNRIKDLDQAGADGSQGILTACGAILNSIPTPDLLEMVGDKENVWAVSRAVCEALGDSGAEQAEQFLMRTVAAGGTFATFDLYSQLRWHSDREAVAPGLPAGLVAQLAEVVGSDGDGWALETLQILSRRQPAVVDSAVIKSLDQLNELSEVVLRFIQGRPESVLEALAKLPSPIRAPEHAVGLLGHLNLDWRSHTDELVMLLRRRDDAFSIALLDDAAVGGRELWEPGVYLSDVRWWLDWMESCEIYLRDRLGRFLARCTDVGTRRELLRLFNVDAERRPILDRYILPHLDGLSLADLTAESIDWLLGTLRDRNFDQYEPPVLQRLADDQLIEERLLPILMNDPPRKHRRNLVRLIKASEARLGRRYIDDGGQPIA